MATMMWKLPLVVLSAIIGSCGPVSLSTADCSPIFQPGRQASSYDTRTDEVIVLFPPEGAVVQRSRSLVISGRAFGDFSGGVLVNGEPATLQGNAFHLWLDPQDVLEDDMTITVTGLGSTGLETSRSEVVVALSESGYFISSAAGSVSPPDDYDQLFDLAKRSCARDVFLFGRAEAGISIEDVIPGSKVSGHFYNDAFFALVPRAPLLETDAATLSKGGITWLGPVVPEMKYFAGFMETLGHRPLDTIQIGDSIVDVPFLSIMVQASRNFSASQRASRWTSEVSDETLHAVVDPSEVRWLVQEPSVVHVANTSLIYCDDCEGCYCDTSVCAGAGPSICHALFGPEAMCELDACTLGD